MFSFFNKIYQYNIIKLYTNKLGIKICDIVISSPLAAETHFIFSSSNSDKNYVSMLICFVEIIKRVINMRVMLHILIV